MKCLIFQLFIVSIVFSVWGILVYEFEYDVVTITSYSSIKGWPDTAKSLSYGIITGWIIYGLTVFFPHKAEKRNRQIGIMSKLVSLNEELSYFIISANIQDDNIEKVEYSYKFKSDSKEGISR
ncbi:MAG: hypothetical protein K2K75_03680 [Muribaculaceae bacterium]|nr:hypothetical protein [Muribaculaceae bacterium]